MDCFEIFTSFKIYPEVWSQPYSFIFLNIKSFEKYCYEHVFALKILYYSQYYFRFTFCFNVYFSCITHSLYNIQSCKIIFHQLLIQRENMSDKAGFKNLRWIVGCWSLIQELLHEIIIDKQDSRYVDDIFEVKQVFYELPSW